MKTNLCRYELEIAKKKNNINFKMTQSWRTEMLATCPVG